MRILFTGGGSGGHIFPIIAVARELKKTYGQSLNLEMFFLGANSFSRNDLEKEGIRVKIILAGKLRRYFSFQNFIDLFKIPIGFCQSLWYLFFWMPDAIFGKGGYGSFSVVLIAWLYRIPVMIHDSDAVPGLANRIMSKISKRIGISFQSAQMYFPEEKTALVGNPIRLEVIETCLSQSPEMKNKAGKMFQIASQKPVLFICGGSQGAQAINRMILDVLIQLLEKYEIIHQCGKEQYEEIRANFSGNNLPIDYHLFPFLGEEQMANAYFLADLVISRAGSGSIFEIAACGKPSILIPLPSSAADHQRKNAFAYAQAGAAVILEQDNLTPNLFLNEINKILISEEIKQKMSNNARNFAYPESAQKIAEGLIELGQ